MRKIGLDQMEEPPINSIAKAAGEVIEENNKRILEALVGDLNGGSEL